MSRAGLNRAECGTKSVGTFSGGMSQRLGIAVALLAEANILILDEPTASLDPEGAAGFLDTIEQLKRGGTTVLFSSHVLSDVETLADRVALLLDGHLVAVESVERLRSVLRRGAPTRAMLHVPTTWRCAWLAGPEPRKPALTDVFYLHLGCRRSNLHTSLDGRGWVRRRKLLD